MAITMANPISGSFPFPTIVHSCTRTRLRPCLVNGGSAWREARVLARLDGLVGRATSA